MRRGTGSLALAVLLAAGQAEAAIFTLAGPQKAEALRVGERSVTDDRFDAEWRVENGAGESVLVLTPFHRLVLASRHAAFKKTALKPREPDKLLKEQAGRLILWASLRGKEEGFARHYQPRLRVGDQEILPSFVQNERTAIRQEGGDFLARCVYGFPTKDVDDRARATLLVRDRDGRDVTRFVIDLGRMR